MAREESMGLKSLTIQKSFFQDRDVRAHSTHKKLASSRKKNRVKYTKISACGGHASDLNSSFCSSGNLDSSEVLAV